MITPSDQQYRAIKTAANWFKNEAHFKQVLTLAGYGGSGKSSILPHIIDEMGLHPEDVHFVAPTGKAAKVVTRKLKDQKILKIATTIHKAIYLPRAEKVEVLEAQLKSKQDLLLQFNEGKIEKFFDSRQNIEISKEDILRSIKILNLDINKALVSMDGPSFTLNPDSKIIFSELIVVDEGSMVGEEIANDLCSFGIPILVMGDPGQLPPVKAVAGFDLSNPDIFLSEIHRQAMDNPIIQLATLAREGNLLKEGIYGDGRARVIRHRNDNVTYNLEESWQVIVGTHSHKFNVTNKIRKSADIQTAAPTKGEPIICIKNSKNNPLLINGSILEVTESPSELQEGSPSFVLTFRDHDENYSKTVVTTQSPFEEYLKRDRKYFSCQPRERYQSLKNDEQFEFAHAITCHKAQGSEWDNVVVHDESGAFRDDACKWLYTAITRASEKLVVVI